MTLEDAAKKLGLSSNTIVKNFKRTQENLAKRGVKLTRVGTNNYEIERTNEEKVCYTISQLIEALDYWMDILGDVPVYRMNGSGGINLTETYKVIPTETSVIKDDVSESETIIIID